MNMLNKLLGDSTTYKNRTRTQMQAVEKVKSPMNNNFISSIDAKSRKGTVVSLKKKHKAVSEFDVTD